VDGSVALLAERASVSCRDRYISTFQSRRGSPLRAAAGGGRTVTSRHGIHRVFNGLGNRHLHLFHRHPPYPRQSRPRKIRIGKDGDGIEKRYAPRWSATRKKKTVRVERASQKVFSGLSRRTVRVGIMILPRDRPLLSCSSSPYDPTVIPGQWAQTPVTAHRVILNAKSNGLRWAAPSVRDLTACCRPARSELPRLEFSTLGNASP